MVKLTEVEDEHFKDKPIPSKNDALLVTEEDDDFTDTGICNSFLSPQLSTYSLFFHRR
jgi:import receptor subunit TOM22